MSHPSNIFKTSLLTVAALFVAAVAMVVLSRPAPSQTTVTVDQEPTPTQSATTTVQPQPTEPAIVPITWTPTKLVVTLAPGEKKTVHVTANIAKRIPATVAEVVPTLAPYVTVTPTNSPASAAGTKLMYTVSFAVASGTAFQTINGTLHLRSGKTTIAQPLSITVNVWPAAIRSNQISVYYPPELAASGGIVGDPVIEPWDSGSTRILIPVAAVGRPPRVTFGFLIEPNASNLSLQDWFTENVDRRGILRAAGTFRVGTLPGGNQALILAGSVPEEYEGGTLEYAYVMSLDTKEVLSASLSDDQDLSLLGYASNDQQMLLISSILRSVTF